MKSKPKKPFKESVKKSWFFEKINKIDKPYWIWQNGRGGRPKLIKSEMKKGT
jgi:hypothetical protein